MGPKPGSVNPSAVTRTFAFTIVIWRKPGLTFCVALRLLCKRRPVVAGISHALGEQAAFMMLHDGGCGWTIVVAGLSQLWEQGNHLILGAWFDG